MLLSYERIIARAEPNIQQFPHGHLVVQHFVLTLFRFLILMSMSGFFFTFFFVGMLLLGESSI